MSKSKLKKCVVLYVEGQTEEEFYKKVKEYMKLKVQKFQVNKFEVVCMKSLNRFKNKLLSKFRNEIAKKDNKYDEIVVVLGYDSDGYEFGRHPKVDNEKLATDFRQAGATKVIHLMANKTIEDWIMIDQEGVLKFLGLPTDTRIKGKTGLEQLQYLFKQKNRQYMKGSKVDGLLDHLNFELICAKLCPKLSELCYEVGISCPNIKDIMKS